MLNANAEKWVVKEWQECIQANDSLVWELLEDQLLILQTCTPDVEESVAYQLLGGIAGKLGYMAWKERN